MRRVLLLRLVVPLAFLSMSGVALGADHRDADVSVGRTLLSSGGIVAVPMLPGGGQPIIEVMLDGRGPYRMFLDTGAGTSVLDSSLAAELGLRRIGSTHIGDPASPSAIAADIVAIDSLRIGAASFRGLTAASWDRATLRPGSNPPRGVLGFAVFRELLLTLDYPAAEVRLSRGALPAADGQTVLHYADPNGIPAVPIELSGVALVADLDTGSPGFLSIPVNDTAGVRFVGPLREMGRGRTVSRDVVFRGAEIDGALVLGQHRFEHPVVTVHDQLPHAVLGGRALRDFVVTFDQHEKTVRFERTRVSPPEAFAVPVGAAGQPPGAGFGPGARIAGVGLAPQADGSLIVANTLPGSAASRADIAAGDRVIEIDGKPIELLGDDERRAALHLSPVTLKLVRDDRTFEVTLEF